MDGIYNRPTNRELMRNTTFDLCKIEPNHRNDLLINDYYIINYSYIYLHYYFESIRIKIYQILVK